MTILYVILFTLISYIVFLSTASIIELMRDYGIADVLIIPFRMAAVVIKYAWLGIVCMIPYLLARKKAARLLNYEPFGQYDYFILTGFEGILIGSLRVSFKILKMKNWTVKEEYRKDYVQRKEYAAEKGRVK